MVAAEQPPAKEEKEQSASDDGFGDFDEFTDPNDVQFPTLEVTKSAEASPLPKEAVVEQHEP